MNTRTLALAHGLEEMLRKYFEERKPEPDEFAYALLATTFPIVIALGMHHDEIIAVHDIVASATALATEKPTEKPGG